MLLNSGDLDERRIFNDGTLIAQAIVRCAPQVCFGINSVSVVCAIVKSEYRSFGCVSKTSACGEPFSAVELAKVRKRRAFSGELQLELERILCAMEGSDVGRATFWKRQFLFCGVMR